ncbi:MAG: cytochrome-c peroxidase [Bacteroidetes bacterium]|nr:cytochrome-c peroxidase [Bacteroidota bacterium]
MTMKAFFGRIITGFVLLLLVSGLFFLSCKKEKKETPEEFQATPYTLPIPKFFPTKLNIEDNNPLTIEGIALGRYLFYDGRIDGRTDPDSMMSCSTCHLQSRSFECGIDNTHFIGGYPYGVTGIPTPHVMLPMINLVFNNEGYLWNGSIWPGNPNERKRRLEDLVWMAVYAPHEMKTDSFKVKAMIQSIPGYPDLFKKAFGSDVVTFENISRAIAQFVRTLVSGNSKFDKYLRGEVQLTNQELNGYVLFSTESGGDCFHCHGGSGNPLFTTNLFYNNGKDSIFTGVYEDTRDRYHVTGNPMDIGAYKAPTLRNVSLTGPYMHDGRFKTLDEVINFYSEGLVRSPYISPLMHHIGTGGAKLNLSQKADLKAFILTLTDNDFLTNPAFSKPAAFPDGTTGK